MLSLFSTPPPGPIFIHSICLWRFLGGPRNSPTPTNFIYLALPFHARRLRFFFVSTTLDRIHFFRIPIRSSSTKDRGKKLIVNRLDGSEVNFFFFFCYSCLLFVRPYRRNGSSPFEGRFLSAVLRGNSFDEKIWRIVSMTATLSFVISLGDEIITYPWVFRTESVNSTGLRVELGLEAIRRSALQRLLRRWCSRSA